MKLGPLQKSTWFENCLKQLTAHRTVDGLDEAKCRPRYKDRYWTNHKLIEGHPCASWQTGAG